MRAASSAYVRSVIAIKFVHMSNGELIESLDVLRASKAQQTRNNVPNCYLIHFQCDKIVNLIIRAFMNARHAPPHTTNPNKYRG